MGSVVKRVFSFICLLFITICLVNAVEQSGTENKIIKIGAIYNLEGSQAPLDVPSSQGAILATEIYNKQDPSKQVILTIKDGKSNRSLMAPITQELIDTSDIPVIIGLSDTDMLIPAAKTAAAANITFLTSGATSPRLPEEVTPYLYLACFGDNAQAAAAAEYAVNNLSAKTAVIYYDGSMNYTTLLGSYFKSQFEELGGEIIQYSEISSENKSLENELADLSEKPVPDLIYLAVGPDDAPDVVHIIRDRGILVPIFGGDSYDTKDLSYAASLSGGRVYYTTHAFFGGENLTPEVSTFITAYQDKYGEVPDAFAGLGYDALNIVLTAMENSGDTIDIRKGFSKIDHYTGVTGSFSYTNSLPIPNKSVTLMLAGDTGPVKVGEIIPENIPTP